MRILPRRRRETRSTGRRRLIHRTPLEERGTMSLLQHLEELRSRLIWIFVSVGIAGIAGWVLFDDVVELLLKPARPYLRDLTHGRLVFTGALDAFTLRLKVAFYAGFAFAFPIVLFHVWRFVSPGLKRNERRYALPFLFAGIVLFAAGAAFGLYTLPQALKWLIGPGITGTHAIPLLSAKSYIEFGLLYLAAFGVGFEFPVILMLLLLIRVVNTRQMARYRRHVFFGIAVAAAVLTPSVDWFTMTALTVVLYVMFEACIWIGKALRR